MSESLANLLIVEDEPITRSQLTAHFEKEGYAVTTSENAEGVVDSIEENLVDICLIDINLPGKDGLTLTRELRASSDVGIILVTGKDDPVDKLLAWKAGLTITSPNPSILASYCPE